MQGIDDTQFWALIGSIEGTGWSDQKSDLTLLTSELTNSSDDAIYAFEDCMAQRLHALDTRRHYKCMFWTPGHSDPFLYKRLAIIAQGREYHERFLNRPFWLKRWPTDWLEGLYYVAREAYELKHGREMAFTPSVDPESFQNERGWRK